MNKQSAFTLVELVVTMLLISILAVTVAPKFFGKSEYSPYAIRDQLISQLRLVQLQALNRRGICHNLVVAADHFGIVNNTGSSCGSIPATANSVALQGIVIKVGIDASPDFQFDSLGRARNASCNDGCTIDVIGSDTVQIRIELEGYIHAV